MLTTIILTAVLTAGKIDFFAQEIGQRQKEFDAFNGPFNELIIRVKNDLPLDDRHYQIQTLIEPDDDAYGVTLKRVRPGPIVEIHFDIPASVEPGEAAVDAAKNVRIALECDLEGKDFTSCKAFVGETDKDE